MGKTDMAAVWYAVLVTLLGAAYIGAITFGTVPEENRAWVDTILGFVLGTVVSTATGYMIGSSKSSSDKTRAMTP